MCTTKRIGALTRGFGQQAAMNPLQQLAGTSFAGLTRAMRGHKSKNRLQQLPAASTAAATAAAKVGTSTAAGKGATSTAAGKGAASTAVGKGAASTAAGSAGGSTAAGTTAAGGSTAAAGPVTIAPSPNPKCYGQAEMDFFGGNLMDPIHVKNASACCNACERHNRCFRYTFNEMMNH